MAKSNQVDNRGKSTHQEDFQGSRYLAIANFKEENPKRTRDLNKVIYLVDQLEKEIGLKV